VSRNSAGEASAKITGGDPTTMNIHLFEKQL
jgi:hypothetical protein